MAKEIKVTATKPDVGQAEYGVYDTVAKAWIRHGEVVTIPIMSLSVADRNAILGTRTLMVALAQAEAKQRGVAGTVKVMTTRPETDESLFSVEDPDTGIPKVECINIPAALASLSAPDRAMVAAAKAAVVAVCSADATTKGFLP